MARPKILLAVSLLVAGTFLPAMTKALDPLPVGAIGMGHEGYSETVIKIHTGDTITFENNSRWIHIIGPGDKGLLATDLVVTQVDDEEAGSVNAGNMGMQPRILMQENDIYTTTPWTVPGKYLITCTVHPDMNATVIVAD